MVLRFRTFWGKLSVRDKAVIVSVLLFAASIMLYWQTGGHEFIHFDDDLYVFENPYVKEGFSSEGIKWAFEAF